MHYATENSINFLQYLVISSVHQSIKRQRIKFSLYGPDNANFLMTSSATKVVSAWMMSNADDVRRYSLMAERWQVFKRFSVEKDRSAVAVVTGRVTSI